MKKELIVFSMATIFLSGCTTPVVQRSDNDFRVVTAKEIDVPAQDVRIVSSSGGERKLTKLTPLHFFGIGAAPIEPFKWTAETPEGVYQCEGDVNLAWVICTPKS